MTNLERKWRGRWINNGKVFTFADEKTVNASYLRKVFTCCKKPEKASIFLCGLGWHVLYVNGQKADDRVLAPTVTQYNCRVSYIEYDVAGLLNKGKNAVTVLLGNGWYNCSTKSDWNFSNAPWRDYPKLLCDILVDEELIAWSDASWKLHDSPITFDALRNGQFYDARLEVPGFADPQLDDSAWEQASLCVPPGGRVQREMIQPCKVMQSYPALKHRFITCYDTVYDFGTNLTGWCKIKVKGTAGTQVEIQYAEKIDAVSGEINIQEIAPYIYSGRFQTDIYILKGDPDGETYEPSFTYHGFRYAMVTIYGKAEVMDIQAQFVHTAFNTVGTFTSSSALLNILQRNTLQSFKSNFTGIPTDCPHREKNGWTGDAAIAAETGLWNFDMEAGYTHFMRILADGQLPSGQLSGIAPTAGWGYNWGSGPAWDNLFFEYPYQIYLFTGKTELIEQYYDQFKLYLDYCESRSEDYLLDFGLGDWCHWDRSQITPVEVTSSGYYYQNVQRTVFFADLLGKTEDATAYRELAKKIRQSFLKRFAHADGSFADNSLTATAAALYFGLVEEHNAKQSAKCLLHQVRAHQFKADFGILGAKYIPRVLADYGYAEEALALITQPEFPGWGWQVSHGATSLWENWNGKNSQNHIMFGDISAWMYQYLGGIRPLQETPGFRKFALLPFFTRTLTHVKVCHRSPFGMIQSEWRRYPDQIVYRYQIPKGCKADIILLGQILREQTGKGEEIL